MFFWLIVLILLAGPTTAQTLSENCASRVRTLTIKGNDVTRREALLAWSGLHQGRMVTAATLAKARQKLLDKGLYKEVEISHGDLCEPEADLTLIVEEKIYHLVYPRISRNGDGDIGLGIRYRGSNLFGENHALRLAYTEKEYANGEDEEDIKLNYDMPLIDAPYLMRWSTQRTRTFSTPSTETVTEETDRFTFDVGRDWISLPFEKPIKVLASIGLSELTLDRQDPALETEPGSYNTLGIVFEYDDIHEEKYRRFGRFFSLSVNKGQSILSSDYKATKLKIETRQLLRLNATDNLNTRILIELASSRIFNEFVYSIGNSRTIRGVEPDTVEGNSRWLANIEYVNGYSRWPSFRSAWFIDIANVFDDAGTVNRSNWKSSLGVGLRWKLTSFVKTDLVLDYAYNPEDNYSKIYGSTSLMF